jgi:hypothetical protein
MTKDTRDNLIAGVVFVGLIGLIWWTIDIESTRREKEQVAQEQRKEAVCPSFLSIARSARDTLIVMRNEPLCNRYVLDNLQ